MSWSKSMGPAAVAEEIAASVDETVKSWAAEQLHVDEAWNNAAGVTAGHQAQIAAAGPAITSICAAHPGKTLSIGAAGHANADGSGYVSVSYNFG